MAAEIKFSQDVRQSVNIWLSTGVTTCRINFNFTDIIHLVRPLYENGNGPCSSLNMCLLSTDSITDFRILVIPKAIFQGRSTPSNLVQLEHETDQLT